MTSARRASDPCSAGMTSRKPAAIRCDLVAGREEERNDGRVDEGAARQIDEDVPTARRRQGQRLGEDLVTPEIVLAHELDDGERRRRA